MRRRAGGLHSTLPGMTGSIWKNLILVSHAITTAALLRENSAGAHFREDFPESQARIGCVHPPEPGAGKPADTLDAGTVQPRGGPRRNLTLILHMLHRHNVVEIYYF